MEINILLLGHNGGLGRAFKYLLKIKKIKCCVVKKEMVNFYNLKKIITQKKISHIVNCIAKTNLSYCEKNKIKAYNANTKIPKIICSIIKKTKIKFIHFSTEAVFLGAKKNTTYSEKDLPCPKTTYGITKFLAEKEVLKQSNTLVVRLPYLFGETNNKQIF